MNTTVITSSLVDFGAGPTDRSSFANCRWHVDNVGCLHVVREGGRGNVASFGPRAWHVVVEGGVVVARAAE